MHCCLDTPPHGVEMGVPLCNLLPISVDIAICLKKCCRLCAGGWLGYMVERDRASDGMCGSGCRDGWVLYTYSKITWRACPKLPRFPDFSNSSKLSSFAQWRVQPVPATSSTKGAFKHARRSLSHSMGVRGVCDPSNPLLKEGKHNFPLLHLAL